MRALRIVACSQVVTCFHAACLLRAILMLPLLSPLRGKVKWRCQVLQLHWLTWSREPSAFCTLTPGKLPGCRRGNSPSSGFSSRLSFGYASSHSRVALAL